MPLEHLTVNMVADMEEVPYKGARMREKESNCAMPVSILSHGANHR